MKTRSSKQILSKELNPSDKSNLSKQYQKNDKKNKMIEEKEDSNQNKMIDEASNIGTTKNQKKRKNIQENTDKGLRKIKKNDLDVEYTQTGKENDGDQNTEESYAQENKNIKISNIIQEIKFVASKISDTDTFFEQRKHGQYVKLELNPENGENLCCYIDKSLSYERKYILKCELQLQQDGFIGIGISDRDLLHKKMMSCQDIIACNYFQEEDPQLGQLVEIVKGSNLNSLNKKKLFLQISIHLKENLLEYSDQDRKNITRIKGLDFKKNSQYFITIETGYLIDPTTIIFTEFNQLE